MQHTLLAGLSPRRFLQRHWQKSPLLAREALPAAAALLTREDLFRLAARDDVESRLVTRTRGRWEVAHGPFTQRRSRTPAARHGRCWCTASNPPAAGRCIVAQVRLPPLRTAGRCDGELRGAGGGVGPHFDSYDVFLLQVHGTRRWRVSAQKDLALVQDAPLATLATIPRRARMAARAGRPALPAAALRARRRRGRSLHHTSIGFRAPHAQELAVHFLDFLATSSLSTGSTATPVFGPPLVRQGSVTSCCAHRAAPLIASSGRARRCSNSWVAIDRTQAARILRTARPPAGSRDIRATNCRPRRASDPRTLMLYRGDESSSTAPPA